MSTEYLHEAEEDAPDLAEATGYRDTETGRLADEEAVRHHRRVRGWPAPSDALRLPALDAAVQRGVHDHAPYRPMCNERIVDGQLRGACLNDDGTSVTPPAEPKEDA